MRSGLSAEHVRQAMPLVTLAALVVVVGIVTPEFLRPQTLLVLASDTATLFVMAVGVTFVIMLGGIDLSIQSVASLTSVVVALCLPRFGYLGFAHGDAGRHARRHPVRPRPRQAEDPLVHRDARDRRHRRRHAR